jgi:hypothetical protein
MKRLVIVFGLAALAACSSNTSTTTLKPAPAGSNTGMRPALVGQWELKKTCAMIVEALTKAGLQDLIPMDVPETLDLPENAPLPADWDPAHPCADAKPPTAHSHTFWPDGTFNSYDQLGKQVDDGTYKIVNDHTFTIGSQAFHYRISGDTIMFDVVIPKHCTSKTCRGSIAWAFSVANPGQRWTRVTSGVNAP